jgi:hypothetical protein
MMVFAEFSVTNLDNDDDLADTEMTSYPLAPPPTYAEIMGE